MADVKAQTTALITFSPFKSRWHRYLSALRMLGTRTKTAPARKPTFLHTAHFCRVGPGEFARAGLSGEPWRDGALLFLSSFNGDPESYFRDRGHSLVPMMSELWSHCVGWRGAQPIANLLAFIDSSRRRSQSYFNAYPGGSQRVRVSLLLRRQIDQLHVLAHSQDRSEKAAIEFAEAFERARQLLRENREPTKDDR